MRAAVADLWNAAWYCCIDNAPCVAAPCADVRSAAADRSAPPLADHGRGGSQFAGGVVCDFAALAHDAMELRSVCPSRKHRGRSRREPIDGWQLGFRTLRDADRLLWRAAG